MANSKYEYVRSFEQPDNLLPNTFIVVRIDGRGFTKLTSKYKFVKPNDRRALDLANAAAEAVMRDLPDLVLAYGQSDEFSFVFHKDCALFERRASKLVTTIVSTFTANYVLGWAKYFPDAPLTAPLPSFDGRAVCYPSNANLRDYLSWRQADCHINNLYNTTFWALVLQGGLDNRVAEKELSGTVSADKNEILFSRFGINYNNEPDMFKKGSVLYRDFFPRSPQSSPTVPSLHHPIPKPLPRPMSQPLERTQQEDFRGSPASFASTSTTRGPTFLSTSRTPSPPPSPRSILVPGSEDVHEKGVYEKKDSLGYPSTYGSISSPPANGSATRQQLQNLTPIPLPPPTLKPSKRPPVCLMPPNSVAQTNTSPINSPLIGAPAVRPRTSSNAKRTANKVSHSANTSISTYPHRPLPKRSPSMSALENSLSRGPPQIPVRISSIPINQPPRKLSLPTQKSYSFSRATNEALSHVGTVSANTPAPRTQLSAHLRTMKELPSPPEKYTDAGIRGSVMGTEPQDWAASPPPTRGSSHGMMENLITNPVIPPSPPRLSTPDPASSRPHTRGYDIPAAALPGGSTRVEQFAAFKWDEDDAPLDFAAELATELAATLPGDAAPREDAKNKNKQKKEKRDSGRERGRKRESEAGIGTAGNEGRPVAMSKTQREKERKKRGKARIIVEHVDIIGDAFWEVRPWILSGRT